MTRTIFIIFGLIPFLLSPGAQDAVMGTGDRCRSVGDSLTVMFWNLENFFDPRDSGKGESDREFSSGGKRRWTWKKFEAKKNRVAKTILLMEERFGTLPDVIGLAEIENSFVLHSLCCSLPLRKAGYSYVHYESPDHRGIDVGLMYRKSRMELLRSWQVPLVEEGDTLRTRAVLAVLGRFPDSTERLFLVNHHPSRYAGAKASETARTLALKTMLDICSGEEDAGGVIAMGDFNDTPDAARWSMAEGVLENLGHRFIGTEYAGKELGTIRYDGKWQLIDFFLVSPALQEGCRMYVCRENHLLEWDRRHPGYKPFRTFSGPRYHGGVSDHLPVILRLE